MMLKKFFNVIIIAICLFGIGGVVFAQNQQAAQAASRRGNDAKASGDYNRAIAEYTEALRLSPDNPFVLMLRCQAYGHIHIGEYQRAIDDCSDAIVNAANLPNRSDRNFVLFNSYYYRANAFLQADQWQSSIEDFESYLRMSSESNDPYESARRELAQTGIAISRNELNRSSGSSSPSSPPAQPSGRITAPAPSRNIQYGSFTDRRDNQTYRTVRIGNQTWMAQNLNYVNSSWSNGVSGRVSTTTKASWCYNNNNSNCATYGRLYTWVAAKEACPAGWRLPSRDDWDALVNTAGGYRTGGAKLRSQNGWQTRTGSGSLPFVAGTDQYGFSALPGGNRGPGGSFDFTGIYGVWWTASEAGTSASYRGMYHNLESVNTGGIERYYGYSVRCVMD